MRILVIGSGGREHALVWKLGQSPLVKTIFAAPGNGGTAAEGAINTPIAAGDIDGLVGFARKERIGLVVPGPELPLTLGIADAMAGAGIHCFGPDRYCAQLEGSKSFAKDIMRRAGVPTASFSVFTDAKEALAHIAKIGAPLVVKADGLAAGKGVVVAGTADEAKGAVHEIMEDRAFGEAGARIILEDYLEGEEVSLLCFCDGKNATPLPSAQDHKAVGECDTGPNTGGMGAYSPAPILPDDQLESMADKTIRPVLQTLAEDGHPFTGVLYAGLMLTPGGPKVLEYNVRFGDPECQPLLMRLEDDLARIMLDCVHGDLAPRNIGYTPKTALGVVLAAKGYPGSYQKGMPITGIENADAMPGIKVFHSGTAVSDKGLVSTGGRVLCVTALGTELSLAQEHAYAALKEINMPGGFYRRDIGQKGIRRLKAHNKGE